MSGPPWRQHQVAPQRVIDLKINLPFGPELASNAEDSGKNQKGKLFTKPNGLYENELTRLPLPHAHSTRRAPAAAINPQLSTINSRPRHRLHLPRPID